MAKICREMCIRSEDGIKLLEGRPDGQFYVPLSIVNEATLLDLMQGLALLFGYEVRPSVPPDPKE
jgi:hypothetical protein